MCSSAETYQTYYLCRLAELPEPCKPLSKSQASSRNPSRPASAHAASVFKKTSSRPASAHAGSLLSQPGSPKGLPRLPPLSASSGCLKRDMPGSPQRKQLLSPLASLSPLSRSTGNMLAAVEETSAVLSEEVGEDSTYLEDDYEACPLEAADEDEELPPETTPRSHERACQYLRGANFFCSGEFSLTEQPALLDELAKHASFRRVPAGAMCFRQGDKVANLWLLLSGEIGIFSGGDHASPRLPVTQNNETKEVPDSWDRDGRVSCIDGTSTFSNSSKIGRRIARVSHGQVFGETAIKEPGFGHRNATARCDEESEMLVLPGYSLARSKAHLERKRQSKLKFLCKYVPGFADLQTPQVVSPHECPSFHFQLETAAKDQIFLRQGCKEHTGFVCVIISGTIHMTRKIQERQETCDVLHTGDFFGTLPHNNLAEPLTVTAASDCELYRLELHEDALRVMPLEVLDSMSKHLSLKMSARLKKSCVERRFGWDQQERNHLRRKVMPTLRPEKNPKLSPWILY